MIVRQLDRPANDGPGDEERSDAGTAIAAGMARSVRPIVAADGAGFSISDVSVPGQLDASLCYKHHTEANIVLEGEGTVEDVATGEVHQLKPGDIYLVFPNERHRIRIEGGMRVISIFNPPLVGPETHDADGSFPPAIEVVQ